VAGEEGKKRGQGRGGRRDSPCRGEGGTGVGVPSGGRVEEGDELREGERDVCGGRGERERGRQFGGVGLTGGPHQGVAAHNRPCARRVGDAGEPAGPPGELGRGGGASWATRAGYDVGRASWATRRLGRGGARGATPVGPRRRASPREGGLGWAKGGGGAARWAARRKRGEKGLGGFYFPFFALFPHLDAYFTNSLNHKQKDA
jgi:hypothetical protein